MRPLNKTHILCLERDFCPLWLLKSFQEIPSLAVDHTPINSSSDFELEVMPHDADLSIFSMVYVL